MPYTVFDSDISGAAAASLSGSRVLYIAWNVLVDGPGVHLGATIDPLALLGVGLVALGDDLTVIGDGAGDHWHAPIWLNIRAGLWTPEPAADPSGFTSMVATRIRWAISPGTSVHLHVFGDA
jgi:hypothetical protein